MKHIFTMNSRNILRATIVVLLCLSGTTHSDARTFTSGEKIYVRSHDADGFEWEKDAAKLFLYCFGSDAADWVSLSKEFGDIYVASMPAKNWSTCIVTRQSGTPSNSSDWSKVWNQTGDLSIDDGKNYLHSFHVGNTRTERTWETINSRTFTAGEQIYVSSKAKYSDNSEGNWADGGANLYLYCFGDDASQWISLDNVCGEYYSAIMPAKKWRACVVTRQSGTPSNTSDWSKVWNQTYYIPLATITAQNYLQAYKEGTTAATWSELSFPAQTHDGSEVIYINRYPSDWGWFGDGMEGVNHVFAYFYNSDFPDCYVWSDEITPYAGSGYLLEIHVPAGSWTNMVLTRQKSGTPGWDNLHLSEGKDNKSEAMPLEIKYLHNFKMAGTSGEGWQWQAPPSVTPTPDTDEIGGASREDIIVCKDAAERNDPYTLAPKINPETKKYAYGESGAPIWWRWSSTDEKWELVSNNWGDVNKNLVDADHTYYYLWTYDDISAYRRFIHLEKDNDCDIACEITSFEYVLTPVNAVDSTFALEGSIAFTRSAGKLVLTYRDSVLEFESPQSPLVFSMKGLKADGKADGSVKYHFIAKFSGDGACVADSIVTAPELTHGNVVVGDLADAEDYFSPYTTQYIHNSSVTLIPGATVAEGDSFTWTDAKGDIVHSGGKGEDCRYTVSKADHDLGADSTLMFIYTEYNAAPVSEDNLMNNGSYETVDVDFTVTSQYGYTIDPESGIQIIWDGEGKNKNVYEYETYCGYNESLKRDTCKTPYDGENGIFGIATNANFFWKRMAPITPKDGVYMAVFDGDSGEKVAWQAKTSENPKLKLQKGTTYMFSFWVANINNYGEMFSRKKGDTKDFINNAILQFKIKYKDNQTGTEYVTFLGDSTNLNLHTDNFWHQNSATFTSPVDADEVTISVVDKNANDFSIGNDFALDDIRFREVSVMTSTIRVRERFDVKFVEPGTNPVNLQVEWVTRPACGQDTCTMRVSFRYPNITTHDIKLTLKDLNTSNSYGTLLENVTLAKTPILGNTDSTDYVGYFTSGSYGGATYKDKVKADAATHNIRAKLTVLDANDVDHGGQTNESGLQAPGIPALAITDVTMNKPDCSGLKYTLDIDLNYTALSGTTLTYYVDNVSKATRTIDYEVTARTKNDVPTAALDADGNEHTLKVSTGHALDCIDTYTYTALKANIVSNFSVKPIQPDCDVEKFRLVASWEVTKPAVTGSLFDTLMIKVGDASPYQILIKAGEPGVTISGNVATGTFVIPVDYTRGDPHPTIKAYMKERGASCYETGSYTDPTTPRMYFDGEITFEDTKCSDSTYTLVVPVKYIMQRGEMRAWLDSATYDKATTAHKQVVSDYTPNKETLTLATIKFKLLRGDGRTHKVHVVCTDAKDCKLTDDDAKSYVAPFRPVIDSVVVTCTTPAFGELTYDATVKVYTKNFRNNGTPANVTVTGTAAGVTAYTAVVPSSGVLEHKFEGLTVENGVERSFTASFDELSSCPVEKKFNSPDAREFKEFTATPSVVDCDGKYDLDFVVTAAEIGGHLVITHKGDVVYDKEKTTISPASRTIEDKVTGLTAPSSAVADTLFAHFTSPTTYKRTDTLAVYTAPAAPTISAASPTASYTTDCEGNVTYTYTINFANQTTDLKLDTAGVNLETYDYATKLAGKSSQEHSLTIPADYKPRTVVAYFEGREDAGCKVTINLPAVKKPEWQFKHGVSAHDCNGKYNDTITITWNDAVAGDLKITKPGETTVIESADKSDGTHTYIVKDLDVDFAGNILRYYFGDRTDCAQEIEATPPTKRSITATHRNFSTITCDGKVNDTIDFVISNPIGNLVLTKENGDPLYTETNVGTNYTYVATNLTAGATLTIKYRLSQGLNCVQTYSQALPPAPTISMTKTAASPSLDCKGIVTRPLVVTFANQTGALVIRDEADKVLDSIPAGDSKLSTGSYVYNWQYSAGTTSHYAYAYFSNRRACATSNVTSDVVIEGQVNTTQKVSVPDCNGVYNDTVFFVWDDNVLGDLVVHNMSDVFVTSTEHAALKHYVVFTGLKVSDGEQKICQFWFSGSSACKDTIIVTPPVLPTITIATESFSKVTCDGKYAVNLQYTITNPMGDLVVTPPVGAAITIQNVGTTGSIYISDLIANGTEQIFQARLTEGLNCTKEHKLTAPATPTLSIAKDGEQSAPNCKGTVTLPIKVTYTNQSLTAYLTLIDDKGDNAIEPILVSELDLSPCAINWNYTADGKEHSVYAYISDRPDCQTDPVRITAPSAPYWEYTRHRSMINCDGNYTDTLRFSWKDASSAFTIDTLDSNGNAITAQRYSNTASTDDVIRLYHGNVADASANIYKVYFAGHAGDCDSIIKNFESGHAPIKPELVINKADTLHGACDDKTYAIAVEWQYKAFAASTMTFNVSGATKSTKRELTYNPEFVNCKDTIKGLPADGASHTLTMKTDVVANCSFEKTDICAPKGNVLTSFKVDTTTLTCTNGNYQLVATWNVEAPAQAYDVLVIVDENDNLLLEETLTSTTLGHTATLPQSYAEGDAATPKTIYAYLKERGKGCAKSDTYSDPVQPTMAIGEVNKTLATNCSDSTYTIVVPVTYKNQRGDMYAWIDTDTRRHKITANEDGTGEAYLADQSAERTTNIKFSNLVADGKQHTIHIACDETQGACAKTKTYDAPFAPVVTSKSAVMEDIQCDDNTYTLHVSFTVENSQNRDATLVFRGGSPVPVSTTDGTYSYKYMNVSRTDNADDDFVTLSFAGNTCTTEIGYSETPKPVAAISAAPVTPHCDSTTFTLDFELSYTYQPEGTLTVKWDDDHKLTFNSANGGFKALNTASQTLTGSITGLPADGRNNQTLHFEFSGAPHACSGEATGIEFPKTPLIEHVEVGNLPPYVAGLDEPYYPTVTVTFKYANGKKIVLEYFDKDGGSHFAYYTPDTDEEESHVFNYANDGLVFNDVAIRDKRKVFAYFDGAEYTECHTTAKHIGEYMPPTNSSIKFETLELINTGLCEQLRYDVKGTLSYVGSTDGDLIVEFDAAHRCTIPESDCIAKQASGQTIAFEIKDVNVSIPDAGIKLKAWFENIAGNPSYSTEVYEPVIPTIKVENAEYQQPACNVTTTSLTFDLLYTRQQGNLHLYLTEAGIEVEVSQTAFTITSGAPLSYSDTEQKATIQIDGLLANLSDRKLRVWFEDTNSCNKTFDLPTAPFGPAITPGEAEASNFTCGSDVYDVTVTFSVANHLGKAVTVRCHGQEKTLAVTDAQMRVLFTDVNRTMDDAADDFVEIFFADASNAADCADSHIKITYVEPAKPVLEVTDAKVDTVFTCGAKEYRVHFNITSSDQIGDCYVIDRTAGGEERTLSTHIGTYSGEEQLTIARPDSAETHDIIVRYTATNCEVVAASVIANPYTKPKPLISLTAIERLCNSELELNLPFAITQGDIDAATLTLTDAKGAKVISDAALTVNDSKDTLSYLLSKQLNAGKYTIEVEASESVTGCVTSDTLQMHVAQDSVVYSKWNDVLLVDNSAGLYSGYQWYENDKPVGDNSQVLYRTDGMTNNSYYCLLTLQDGGQIYTCEYVFQHITPSVEEQQPGNSTTANRILVRPNRVVQGGAVTVQQSEMQTLQLILLSATGQRIAEYTQTDSSKPVNMPTVQGVYLLRITSDSGLQTEKIVVY